MPEPANSLNCHKIARTGAAVPQRVECSDTGAQQWSRLSPVKPVWNARHSFNWRHHVLRVAAIKVESRNRSVVTVGEIARAARWTGVVLTSVPANANAIPFFPRSDTRADLINHARDFMP